MPAVSHLFRDTPHVEVLLVAGHHAAFHIDHQDAVGRGFQGSSQGLRFFFHAAPQDGGPKQNQEDYAGKECHQHKHALPGPPSRLLEHRDVGRRSQKEAIGVGPAVLVGFQRPNARQLQEAAVAKGADFGSNFSLGDLAGENHAAALHGEDLVFGMPGLIEQEALDCHQFRVMPTGIGIFVQRYRRR